MIENNQDNKRLTAEANELFIELDTPISTPEQDRFNSQGYARHLADFLVTYSDPNSLTIGLCGKWGSGKTSVINLALYYIDKDDCNNKPIIVRYNPWNCVTIDQLIEQFFNTLKEAIGKSSIDESKVTDIVKLINEYSELFEAAALIPVIGHYAIAIRALVSLAARRNDRKGNSAINKLEGTKDKINKKLGNLDRRIVVVIDDIDRTSDEQIRMLFQLVHAIAGFENTTYLLAFDQDIVSAALNKTQADKGDEYIEKIVQLPLMIPAITIHDLRKIMDEELSNVVREVDFESIDRRHYLDVLINCVYPCINTMRDVRRFISTFSFAFTPIQNDVNLSDMLGIAAIQVFYPQIAEWISVNRSLLCGENDLPDTLTSEWKEKEYAEFFKSMLNGSSVKAQYAINAISALFPSYKRKLSDTSFGFTSTPPTRGDNRISNVSKFDRYFSLALHSRELSTAELNHIINSDEETSLSLRLDSLIDRGVFTDFLFELDAQVNAITSERAVLISRVLLGKLRSTDEKYYIAGLFPESVDLLIESSVRKLMKLIGQESSNRILAERVEDSNYQELVTLALGLREEGFKQGFLGEDQEPKPEEMVLMPEDFERLVSKYVDKLRTYPQVSSLLRNTDAAWALEIWKHYDKKGFDDFLTKSFEADPINRLCYVSLYASSYNGSDGNGWMFESNNYKQAGTKQEILAIIKASMKKIEFWNLPIVFAQRIAGFVLASESKFEPRANEKEAEKLLRRWASENTAITDTNYNSNYGGKN